MRKSRNAYWVASAVAAVVLLPGAAVLALPHLAGAFWPFSVTNAETGTDDPVLHDSSLALLQAAVNSDTTPLTDDPITTSEGMALLANGGPDGTLPDVIDVSSSGSHPSSNGQISTYIVKNGDSLSEIAESHGVSINTILWANDISNPNTIKPGDTLIILPVNGLRYTVKKGDTLSTIASKYKADAKEIAIFNGITTETALAAGSDIVIPGGEQQTTASKAAVAKATKTTSSKTTNGSDKASLAAIEAPSGSAATGGYFINPVPGAILTQGIHGNNAVDLGIPTGTPIKAAAAGTVIIAKTDGGWNGGYGNYVVISHGNGTQTLYAHMSKDIASVGEKVSQGTVIGYVGITGEATGPHLHFEVRGGKNPFGSSCSLMKKCY